jgi:hypothetical protein
MNAVINSLVKYNFKEVSRNGNTIVKRRHATYKPITLECGRLAGINTIYGSGQGQSTGMVRRLDRPQCQMADPCACCDHADTVSKTQAHYEGKQTQHISA